MRPRLYRGMYYLFFELGAMRFRIGDATGVKGLHTSRETRIQARSKALQLNPYAMLAPSSLDLSRVGFHGREDELRRCSDTWSRILDRKEPHVLVIEGEAGCGKSGLVDEFVGRVSSPCFVCRGKFDDCSTAEPFSAISESLGALAQQLAADSSFDWSGVLSDELRAEIRCLSLVVPEMRSLRLSSTDDDSTSYLSNEGRLSMYGFDRLKLTVRAFFRVVSARRPIIWALDDLQWMDESSRLVLESVALDQRGGSLLIMGTCRSDTFDRDVLESIFPDGNTEWMTLQPLSIDNVISLTSRAIRREEIDVRDLAWLIHRKTGGNSFFILRFIEELVSRDLVEYSIQSLRWEFDVAKVSSETQLCDNVLQLVSGKVEAMTPTDQAMLTTASALGASHFDAEILSLLLEDAESTSVESVEASLAHAVREGLLEQVGVTGRYKFAHDRIRETVSSMLPKGLARTEMHLSIGQKLWEYTTRDEQSHQVDRMLVLAAQHVRIGCSLLQNHEERRTTASMLLEASELAFELGSWPPVRKFMSAASSLLEGHDRWAGDYNLTLKLQDFHAHVLYSMGYHEECHHVIEEVLDNATSLEDRLAVYRTVIMLTYQEGSVAKSISTCIDVIRRLGIWVPNNNHLFHGARLLLRLRRRMSSYSSEQLLGLPRIEDQKVGHARQFLWLLTKLGAYVASFDLQLISLCILGHTMLDHGHDSFSAFTLAGFAAVMGTLGEHHKARYYGDMAFKLVQDDIQGPEEAFAISTVLFFGSHWHSLYHKLLEQFLRMNAMLLDFGSIDNAISPAIGFTMSYFASGLPLMSLKTDSLKFFEMVQDYDFPQYVALLAPLVQMTLNFLGESEDPCQLDGAAMREDQVHVWKGYADERPMAHYHFAKMVLGYWFHDYELAFAMERKLLPVLKDGPYLLLPVRHFFEGLVAFARNKRRRGHYFLTQLLKYCKIGNPNCHHMYLLLKAEQEAASRRRKPQDSVQRAYDEAVLAAGRLGFTHHQALANERAGIYFLRRGENQWASTYLTRACSLYLQWGAASKVQHLLDVFGSLVSIEEARSSSLYGGTSKRSTLKVYTPENSLESPSDALVDRDNGPSTTVAASLTPTTGNAVIQSTRLELAS